MLETQNDYVRFHGKHIPPPLAPFGWLIFISPSVPIGDSDGALALIPIHALSDPLPPILADIHHTDHPHHILGHGVSTFLV